MGLDIIIGKCRSGKSELAKEILKKKYLNGERKVFLIKNPAMESEWIDERLTFTDLEMIEKIQAEPGEKVIILEDVLSNLNMSELKQVEKYISVWRHTHTNWILITQTLTSLPPSIRTGEITNDSVIWLAKQIRKERRKKIYEEVDVFESLEEYEDMNKNLKAFEFIKIEKDTKSVYKGGLSNYKIVCE